MTKSFSPAGMAVKAYYGLGARTFGNPDGAHSGGGAYAAGGANPNGPNQGGGGVGPPVLVAHQRNAIATPADVAVSAGVWIAVGLNEVWRSLDAKTWTLVHSFAATIQLGTVTRGSAAVWATLGLDTGGVVVAFTSPDGIVWTQQFVTPAANQSPIGVAFGNGVFLSDDTFAALRSTDTGATWVDGAPFATSSGFGTIRFDGTNFLCLVNSNSGCPGPPAVLVTANGNVFTQSDITEFNPISNPTDIVKGGLLYAVIDSAGEISTSPSAIWNGTLRASVGKVLTGIAYGGTPASQFLAVALDGSIVLSPDGIVWTPVASAGATNFLRVAFEDPFFTAVGTSGIWTYGPASAG